MSEIKAETRKPTCFVIMPFSDPEGYDPGHFRSVYEYTFKPAIEAAGYEALRIDDNSVSNLIHSKMMNELVTAPMVLCDLSTNNPNVLYELGIRHAFDKPVVLVQEIGQNRIFDIAGITSVEYHPTRRYEETVDDHNRIRDAIIQTAEAKSKYSILSLVALQSAQPIDDRDVSPEEQTSFMLQQMMQKINNLETQMKATIESQKTQYLKDVLVQALKHETDKDGSAPYLFVYDKDGKMGYAIGDLAKKKEMDYKKWWTDDYLVRPGKRSCPKLDKKSTSEQTQSVSDDES